MEALVKNKEIWKIALPIMLGNLAQTIITFTDTAFLGHLGVVSLGASMMAGMYYFVYTTLALGFAVGIQIIIARRFGEKRFNEIATIFNHGAIFVAILGISLLLLLLLFSKSILVHIIDSPNILAESMEYIKFRQFGIIFVCFNYLYRSLYIGLSNTKVITYSTLLMAVVNIFLDYCLIFGKLGFPEMGIGGAALASLSAEISASIFFTIYTFFKVHLKDIKVFSRHKIEMPLLKNILSIGAPTMVQRLLSFSAWFIFFIMIEKMGELAIGISSIVRSAYMILIIPSMGFATTADTIVSRLIGQNKNDYVMPTVKRIFLNCIICSIPLALLSFVFPTALVSIYTNDADLMREAIPSIYVICLACLTMSFGSVFFESVSGTGNTRTALFLEFGVLIIYTLYILMMVNVTSHVHFVWTAEFVYGILLGIISYLYIKNADWRKKVI